MRRPAKTRWRCAARRSYSAALRARRMIVLRSVIFFERAPFLTVRRHLPEDLQVAVTLAYTFGFRMQSEVLTLERRHVDLEAGTVRLGAETKTDEGRVIYLTPECARLVAAQVARVEALQRRLGRIVPWLFPHGGTARRGCSVMTSGVRLSATWSTLGSPSASP